MLIEQGVITHIRRRKIDEQQPTNQLTNPLSKIRNIITKEKDFFFLIKCYKITIPIIFFFSHFCDTLTTTNNLNNLISLF